MTDWSAFFLAHFHHSEENMIPSKPGRRLFAGVFVFILCLSSFVNARPLPDNLFTQQEGAKQLPPVNWIRSRKIDVKNILIDLRFDWDKKQALGVTTITLAPFTDSDKINLDAASMSIKSVTLVDGKPLKFNYKGGN